MGAAPIPVLPAQIDAKVQRNRSVAYHDLATPDILVPRPILQNTNVTDHDRRAMKGREGGEGGAVGQEVVKRADHLPNEAMKVLRPGGERRDGSLQNGEATDDCHQEVAMTDGCCHKGAVNDAHLREG